MAGDPDLETTALLLRAVARAGAGAIELGIPYGDPLADGATIAAAGMRALRNRVSMADLFQLVGQAPAGMPIVLFTYFNPVHRYGVERFARDAARAGAAGVIVPDIALEEGRELRDAVRANALDMPLLIAPSTPLERAARISLAATGFVYVVSRLGVTGADAAPNFAPLRAQVSALRGVTDKPLALGFGISKADHVRQVRHIVDGVIVGTALIEAYAGTRAHQAARRIERFCRELLA